MQKFVSETITVDDPRRGSHKSVQIQEPRICPVCGVGAKPIFLQSLIYSHGTHEWILLVYQCPVCGDAFVTKHIYSDSASRLLYQSIFPVKPKPVDFADDIKEISPEFCRLYDQAYQAEYLGLPDIAGIGYRRAVEFLVKDFLIKSDPESAEAISKMELAKCIANKVSSEKLKLVASRCTWIGNDYAHYVNFHPDLTLQDLKDLIDATTYWILMEAIATRAAAIPHK